MTSDDHPIDPAIRVEIETRLAAIESDHGVRVLYACESGSRGWGFASPDSDYDVRFLYVHPLTIGSSIAARAARCRLLGVGPVADGYRAAIRSGGLRQVGAVKSDRCPAKSAGR